MDPDANLEQQLELARELISKWEKPAGADIHEMAEQGGELAELVLALDGWLQNGGFLPCRWEKRR